MMLYLGVPTLLLAYRSLPEVAAFVPASPAGFSPDLPTRHFQSVAVNKSFIVE